MAYIGPKYSFPALLSCLVTFSGGSSSHGVKASDLFSALPTFDADAGAHRCVVTPRPIADAALLEAASKVDADVVLTVTTRAKEDSSVSGPVSIPFVAPFFILSPESSSSEALVASSGAEGGATVLVSASATAAEGLEVSSTQPELVAIEKERSGDGITKITITVIDDTDLLDDVTAEITIVNTLTGKLFCEKD